MTAGAPPRAERVLGRYALFDEIAAGGMATVHLGRMLGPVGFSKTVAIKRLHANLARDPEFVSMFLDEARVAARIQHPNVVATLDVVATEGEVFLVLDYVQGESLSHLLKATLVNRMAIPPRVLSSILVNALHGLHAAHEATDEHGNPLEIVHRDVSPQNILVGVDGVARVLDFGVAKAAGRLQSTRDGQLKGKLAYMAPEQIRGGQIDRRTDVYAAGIVLWEGIAGRRLIHSMNEAQVLQTVLEGNFPPPSSENPSIPPDVDALVMHALANDPNGRYRTAREFAIQIERAIGVASPYEVAEWVQTVGAEALSFRAARVREMESSSAVRVALQDGQAQILHDPIRTHDRSGSGVVQSPPVPDYSAPSEASSSIYVHPSLHVQEPSYPSAPAELPHASSPAYVPPIGYPAAPATPSGSGAKIALVGIALMLLVGLIGIVLLFVVRTRGQAEPPSSVASAAKPVAPPKPLEPAPAPEPAQPVVIMPNASATPKPETKVETKPEPKPETKVETKPSTKSEAKPAAKPPKGCDSPFFVDENGIKHVKPECM